ncbi:MAG: DUF1611 domain-containing protein [Planctomycetales bacterium]|nr:DUF1611 domain-containing protein [Planctomycetales bacterium]NIO33887.1 DUF1611 domain-containing protein [Planctomycetales bacterium]NIO45695.1 DUF1611 domain-containing protein [Planctomycetales bacterium]NIP84533.1 DUF1611 domain-containing protein [Planctomycetales bacterium]
MTLPATSLETTPRESPRFDLPAPHLGVDLVTRLPAEEETKWGWACRAVDPQAAYLLPGDDSLPPVVGDVALVEVTAVKNHTRIVTRDHQRLRIYEGDQLVGVFGNRYATDAFEAQVAAGDQLHLLTSAGMIGTVVSRNQKIQAPTQLRMLGHLATRGGRRINLLNHRQQTALSPNFTAQVVLAVGTGMNSGKTTTAAKLVKALVRRKVRVAACKLTGSVCHRDLSELQAAGAQDTRDFSDYGFPSTYLCQQDDLVNLYQAMLADSQAIRPDVVVMEIADGVLQRETELLLSDPSVQRYVRGVVLAAPCSASALFGAEQIRRHGLEVIAVSGIISNSPLFMREFSQQSDLPLASSVGDAAELAQLVTRHCHLAAS